MVIKRADIPEVSIIKNEEKSFDYIDSFQSFFSDKDQKIGLTDVVRIFASGGPKWAESLLKLRNILMKPFGLKTGDDMPVVHADEIKYEAGEQIGIFKLLDKAENEIILGEEDKHLNFKVSMLLEPVADDPDKKKLSITTAVHFNNFFGRLYFLPVKPFHKMILRSSLKDIIYKLEQHKEQ
ncbi:DUF2867 domain-containing protein [Prevotella sp. 10(H)]|uniref:DUF2867 domain-containing protein n=1 Tax=Prevotella sp. 10(H) TaxID=1158294 RepID=UPI00068E32F4|nr:DUF2867 domain-containing protein [Prevotella sp. 10(H)]